jgi:hypothetical protein
VEISRESLHAHYKNYSDESLLEAAAAGPGSYSHVAWGVIQELIASRHLAPDATSPAPPPAPYVLPPDELEAFPISPYFILSRLLRGQRWPAGKLLPLAGRRLAADLALFVAGICVLEVLALVALQTPSDTAPPGIVSFALLTALTLAFGLSGRRSPTPFAWRFTMFYFGASPVLTTLPLTENSAPDWRHGALAVIGSAAWLLYFARRRETYGLPPWLAIL